MPSYVPLCQGPGAVNPNYKRASGKTGRQYIGKRVLKDWIEPRGAFEGTVTHVTRGKQEDKDDCLTFTVIFDDGVEEKWNESDVHNFTKKMGRQPGYIEVKIYIRTNERCTTEIRFRGFN